MLIDSLDGLKDSSGVGGMASTPRITSDLLRNLSLPTSEGGHLVIFTAQKRVVIESKYTKNEERDPFSMSGGCAIQNYSDWIFQFAPHDQKASHFFKEKGAFTKNEDGTFIVNFDKMEEAMNEYIDLRRSQGRRPFIDAPHFELVV
jgi:hypothetical protein